MEASNNNSYYKHNETDVIEWIDNTEQIGVWEFTFDRKKIYNMFRDYPYKMTPDEIKIFNKENPYWADFFKDRFKK